MTLKYTLYIISIYCSSQIFLHLQYHLKIWCVVKVHGFSQRPYLNQQFNSMKKNMYIDEISLHSQPARQELSQLGDPQRIGLPLRRLRRWGFERPEDVAGPTTISLGMIVFYVERSMNRFFCSVKNVENHPDMIQQMPKSWFTMWYRWELCRNCCICT